MGEIDFGDLQFDNLEAVTLSRANLTSLKNFPTFPSLVKVRLTEGLLKYFHHHQIFPVGSLSQPIVQRSGELEGLHQTEMSSAEWKQIQSQ